LTYSRRPRRRPLPKFPQRLRCFSFKIADRPFDHSPPHPARTGRCSASPSASDPPLQGRVINRRRPLAYAPRLRRRLWRVRARA
jgi:hypothetical protein